MPTRPCTLSRHIMQESSATSILSSLFTGKLWYSLPFCLFPPSCDLDTFKEEYQGTFSTVFDHPFESLLSLLFSSSSCHSFGEQRFSVIWGDFHGVKTKETTIRNIWWTSFPTSIMHLGASIIIFNTWSTFHLSLPPLHLHFPSESQHQLSDTFHHQHIHSHLPFLLPLPLSSPPLNLYFSLIIRQNLDFPLASTPLNSITSPLSTASSFPYPCIFLPFA